MDECTKHYINERLEEGGRAVQVRWTGKWYWTLMLTNATKSLIISDIVTEIESNDS